MRRLVLRQDPGVADRRSDRDQLVAERLERCPAPGRADARPRRERRRRGGTEDMEIPSCKLESRLCRIDVRCRHRPDRRLPGAIPSQHDTAGRGSVPERVRVDTQSVANFAVRQLPAVEECLEPVGEILRERSALRIVREPPEREDRPVGRRDDVGTEPRTPDLDE
jgi:hypothetical protein